MTTEVVARGQVVKQVYIYSDAGRMYAQENYYTEEYAESKGIVKGIFYYDKNSQKRREEKFYTNQVKQDKGWHKQVIEYDPYGFMTKNQIIDKNKNIILPEGE